MNVHRVSLCLTVAALMFASAFASSGLSGERERRTERTAAVQVELFEGMAAGTIEVSFIPADSRSANVIIKNKTDKPLTIKLPDAFAGVPVLAQFDGGMGGDMGMGGGGGLGGGGGGMQGMGGGMGGMGMGGMGGMGGFGGGGFGGMGGGFFNVAPEKSGKMKVTTVCLEHGKTEPSPRVKYTIKPISALTSDPRVIEVCKMVGRGEVRQDVAQAAAWHLADGLSWQELAAKDRVQSRFGNVKYFSPQVLELAIQMVGVATARSNQAQPAELDSPGEIEQRALSQR